MTQNGKMRKKTKHKKHEYVSIDYLNPAIFGNISHFFSKENSLRILCFLI